MPWPVDYELSNDQLRNQALNLSVDFYAVDPGTAGDCGIYYLIEHPLPASRSTDRPFIHRAALIDGGYGIGAPKILKFLIERAALLYSFRETQGDRTGANRLAFPPFDSILITHWDEDHYGGVIELLNQHATEAFASGGTGILDTYLSPYLKYLPKVGGSDLRGNRATSVIYAPYWGNWTGRTGLGAKAQRMNFPSGTSVKTRPYMLDPQADGPNIPPSTTFLNWKLTTTHNIAHICKFGAGLRCILGTNLFTNFAPANYTAARSFPSPQALALFHKNQVMPTDPPPDVNAGDAWPTLVIVGGASSDNDLGDPPNVWTAKCVADSIAGRNIINTRITKLETDMAVITEDTLKDREPDSEWETEVREHFETSAHADFAAPEGATPLAEGPSRLHKPHGEGGKERNAPGARNLPERRFVPPPIRIVDEPKMNTPAKMTNGASLITMVIWTTGQMSLYSAGDAMWDSEMRVVAWTSLDSNKFKSVRTVKVSHHGGKDSTPYELIRAFKPRRIVFMSNQNPKGMWPPTKIYGHPRFELLLWLYLWILCTKSSRVTIDEFSFATSEGGQVSSSTFPFYLLWGPLVNKAGASAGDGFIYPIAHGTGAFSRQPKFLTPDVVKYQKSLTAMAGILRDNSLDYLTGYSSVASSHVGANIPVAIRRYLAAAVAEAWTHLSQIQYHDEDTPLSLVQNKLKPGTYAPDRGGFGIQYIKVCCRPVDSGRRQAGDYVIDGFNDPVAFSEPNEAVLEVEQFIAYMNSSTPPSSPSPVAGAAASSSASAPAALNATMEDEVNGSQSLAPNVSISLALQTWAGANGAPSSGQYASPFGLATAPVDSNPAMQIVEEDGDGDGTLSLTDNTAGPKLLGGGDRSGASLSRDAVGPSGAKATGIVVPPALPAPAPTTPFYLIPDFLAAKFNPNSTAPIYQIPSGSMSADFDPYSVFISLLDMPAIYVNPSGSLVDNDPLRYWLLLAVQVPPSTANAGVTVDVSGSPASATVSSMTITLPSTSTQPALQFSTKTLQGNFADRASVSLPLSSDGYFPTHSFLAFGLDLQSMGGSSQWPLSQVLQQVNVLASTNNQFTGPVITALLSALSGKLDLELKLEKGMIWFSPRENYLTIQRLEWGLDGDALQTLHNWCTSWIPWSVDIQNLTLVGRRESWRAITQDGWTITTTYSLLVTFDLGSTGPNMITFGLDMNFAVGSTTLIATLRIDPSSDNAKSGAFSSFLSWLVPGESFSDLTSIIPGLDHIFVRMAEVRLVQSNGTTSISQVTIMTEYSNPSWTVQNPAGGGTPLVVPLLMTYTWTKGLAQPHSVNVRLWLEPSEMTWFPAQVMPRYEDIYHIRPTEPAPPYLPLQAIMPGSYQLPTELALDITSLVISLENTTVSFTGTLQRDPAKQATNHLGIQLDAVALSASYTWESGDPTPQESSYQITLNVAFDIGPDPNEEGSAGSGSSPNTADGMILCEISLESTSSGSHSDKYFKLLGTINSLSLAQLARFFPDGDSDVVQSLLGHIVIGALVVDYEYDSSGIASSFAISAILTLGPVELDLAFSRTQSEWQFDATLEAVDPTADATVGSILQEVLGPNSQIVADVPAFVQDINLAGASIHLSARAQNPPPTPGGGGAGGPSVAKLDDSETDNGSLCVCLELKIPGPDGTMLELAYLQITEKAAPGQKADTSKTKRVVIATVAGLPWNKIPQVPVIDSLKPAFDALGFYWVSDPTWTDPTLQPGLTAKEVEKLSQLSPITYKDPTPAAPAGGSSTPSSSTGPPPIVLPAGMHFVVLDSGGQGATSAILDYLFDKPTLPSLSPSPSKGETSKAVVPVSSSGSGNANGSGNGNGSGSGQGTDATPTGTSKGSFEKKIGPFTITNVGIRYEDGSLIIYLDILANLGPIGLDLLGFGFGMSLSLTSGDTGASLLNLIEQVPTLHLQGMGVEYDEPPVAIAGLFDENNGLYTGGIALTIDPYSFIAIGAYGEVTQTDQNGNTSTYKTVFFFAKLDGPLLELEVITVSGICLGFGYNSSIRFPSVSQVCSFPFVQNSELSGADPLAVMQKMTTNDPNMGVISPQPGSYWLAAGLQGKLVQMLDVSAVVVLEFNPYVNIGIFAQAIAQMPPQPTARDACILYAELGIVATVDFAQGAFSESAQLSPNSFVINPSCHLTGGYALCYWFPPSGHVGDFVFTLGGYHSAFRPPPHYPVVERLGISWDLGGGLKITGQAYFAITPRACMAGGVLNANFDQGLLHAYLNAWADALIEYHPFSMLVGIGLDVGVRFTLELLFISIDISISIGAQLTLWAAPFGGSVYVDFWVFGFTIGFGDDKNDQAVDIEAFRELLANVPDANDPTAGGPGVPSTVDKLHILSVESGRYAEGVGPADNETKQGDVWQVKSGGFVFRVQSRVPLQSIAEPGTTGMPGASTSWPASFYAIPMHQTATEQLQSSMIVTIIKDEDQEPAEFGIAGQVLKQMPLAIWGPWDPNNHPGDDPSKNNIASQLDPAGGGTTQLMMGASFAAPPPEIAPDILQPVPVLQAAAEDVFTEADIPPGGKEGDEHPKLPADAVFQGTQWRSAQPTAGAAQWSAVVNAWEAPEIVLPDSATPQATPGNVVDLAIGLWGAALGWTTVDAADATPATGSVPYFNALTNELKVLDGVSPTVWTDFGDLYMAAPVIGVDA